VQHREPCSNPEKLTFARKLVIACFSALGFLGCFMVFCCSGHDTMLEALISGSFCALVAGVAVDWAIEWVWWRAS